MMLDELYPELAVTVVAYEKLVEVVGMDSKLVVFYKQVRKVKNIPKPLKWRSDNIYNIVSSLSCIPMVTD